MPLSFLTCKTGVIMPLFSFPKRLAAHRGKSCLAYVNHGEQPGTGGLPPGIFCFCLGSMLFMDRGCLSIPQSISWLEPRLSRDFLAG